MSRKIIISLLLIGALVAAVGLGLVGYRAVRAARSPAVRISRLAHQGGGGDIAGGITNEDLANALGITVDQLTTARQTANNAALDQAVKDGLITQAQADQLRQNGSAFPFGGRWGVWLSEKGIDYDQFLSDALGITVEKLQAAYTQAFYARIDQAVTNGRLTQEQADLIKGRYALSQNEDFRSAEQSAFEAAVNQAVQDGVITQAQADQILNSENGLGLRMFRGFDRFEGFGMGRGHHGDFFGRGGRGIPGNPNTNPSSANPTTPQVTPSSGL